jgi:hypothetical protein
VRKQSGNISETEQYELRVQTTTDNDAEKAQIPAYRTMVTKSAELTEGLVREQGKSTPDRGLCVDQQGRLW